jgi:pilus assembly protein CpaF
MAGAGATPLVEIERAAQARAKHLALDPAAPDGESELRAIVESEVERWSRDHKRGVHAFDLADPAAVAERAVRNLVGYGPLDPLLG